MKLTLERQIPLGFIIAVFLLAAIIFFAFCSMNSVNEALNLEKHKQKVLLQLDETLILMINAEFRILFPDGKVRWSHCIGQPQIDSSGEVIQIVGNCRDITEQREAENEREEILKKEQAARRDAEIANRLRDEFLATVSHELRAPLNSIPGWGRLLEKELLDKQTTQKAIETIIRNAETQNHLIEDLLDVSRIISGKLRLEISTIKPLKVIEAAMETVRPAAEAKDITLEIKSLSPVSHISGDPNRLQQIIWNLLSNAIKFTPNGGRVKVELERTN